MLWKWPLCAAAALLLSLPDGAATAQVPGPESAPQGFNRMRPEDARLLAADGFHTGSDAAQLLIGEMAEDGLGMARDIALARRMYEAAAAQGNGTAAYRLALMYRDGHGVPQDAALADQYIAQAAQAGHPAARHIVAERRQPGTYGPAVSAAQREQLQAAASAYDRGEDPRAFELLLTLAAQGVTEAQYRVARMYHWGEGTPVNAPEAAAWAAKAGAVGHPDAAALAAHMAEFHGLPSREWAVASSWYYAAGIAHLAAGNVAGARQMAAAISQHSPADANGRKLREAIRKGETSTGVRTP